MADLAPALAPLVFQALDLTMSREQAVGLVIRLGMLVQHSLRMQSVRAESARQGRE